MYTQELRVTHVDKGYMAATPPEKWHSYLFWGIYLKSSTWIKAFSLRRIPLLNYLFGMTLAKVAINCYKQKLFQMVETTQPSTLQ